MSWDPTKPIDEQPDKFWRLAPWAFIGLAVIVGFVLLAVATL